MRARESRLSEQQQELSRQMASMVQEYDEDKREALNGNSTPTISTWSGYIFSGLLAPVAELIVVVFTGFILVTQFYN